MKQNGLMVEHLGVIEPTGFGWVGWCKGCGHMTTPNPCPHTASDALVELCEAARA